MDNFLKSAILDSIKSEEMPWLMEVYDGIRKSFHPM